VAIFGASSWRLWAPQLPHLHLLLPGTPCPICEENNYRNLDCLRPGNDQVCLRSILPATVTRRLARVLSGRKSPANGKTGDSPQEITSKRRWS